MVRIRPFRGWRYNAEVVENLASVICPPYDIIDRELEEALQRLSPYNAVFLEGAERPDWNAPARERYAKAAELFQDWRRRDVLRRDDSPAYYLMRHNYSHGGREYSRTGLICCVELAEYDEGQVLRHEHTQEPAVLDRVALMDECNANFSPIMSLYRDRSGELQGLYRRVTEGEEPLFRVQDHSSQEMALWSITGRELQEEITSKLEDIPAFLADGHHRYEAALRLRGQEPGQNRSDESLARNFVMMTLFDFDDPGVLVLPYHRVVGGLDEGGLERVRSYLDSMFDSEPAGSFEELRQKIEDSGPERKTLGVAGLDGPGLRFLTLKEEQDWCNWGPLAASEGWILEEQVLKPALGDASAQCVDYAHDHDLALTQVASGEQQLAFLLKPFPMDGFESIVGAGHLLPRKSTFFYPKLPTGLVINGLEGGL